MTSIAIFAYLVDEELFFKVLASAALLAIIFMIGSIVYFATQKANQAITRIVDNNRKIDAAISRISLKKKYGFNVDRAIEAEKLTDKERERVKRSLGR